MYSSDPPAGRSPVIAVIGAGASGTLTVIHLLREATSRRFPLRIVLIDRHERRGHGQADASTHPGHLLKTPADMMSAIAGDPGHFSRWAQQAGLPGDFLPRSAYGRYLSWLLGEAERAAPPGTRVSHLTSEVVAIRRTLTHPPRLHLAAGGRIDAGIAVLATGNLPLAPGSDITAAASPLLQNLLSSGLARPDPLRLGLDTDSRRALRDAAGRPLSDLFAIGPLLRGRWYETTAVPEIRDQAAVLARSLHATLAEAGPGSAA